MIAWDTARDIFTDGAWFKDRIYEDRCDVSPDGQLLVTFCHGGCDRPGYTASWTAVSRPPWLYAVALWPWGSTWGGGGRFTDERSLVLHSGFLPRVHPKHPAAALVVSPSAGTHHARQVSTGEPDTQWSGLDHAGKLIFCRAGKCSAAWDTRTWSSSI